jgi:hypothetical protein
MKKLFLILCAIAFGMSGAKADVNLTMTMSDFNTFEKLPAKYTADSKDKAVTATNNSDGSKPKRRASVSVYDDDFKFIKEITADATEFTDDYYFPCIMRIYTSDNLYSETPSGNALYVTQTLFNDDAKYEYLMAVVDQDRSCRSLKVKSEDGNTLSTIQFPDGYKLYSISENDVALIELNGKNYIIIKVEARLGGDSYDYYNLVYKIDASTSSVKQVGAPIKVKVSPTIVERGEMINVALPEIGANTGVINVVSTAGAVVFNQKVEAGTSQASIDTSSLQRGLYIVTIDNGKTRESTKIIIR